MAVQDRIRELQNFKFDQLDLNNVGAWPLPIRAAVLGLVAVIVLGLGFAFFVSDKRKELEASEKQEATLKGDYEQKAFEAHNIESLRKQAEELEASLQELQRQLPKDTEVPSLLEDITNTALEANLKIESVELGAEAEGEIYIELPIEIKVEGAYHDLAGFVSGVANLSRIVTLHDFELAPREGAERLAMTIQAKTYRYRETDEAEGGAEGNTAGTEGEAAGSSPPPGAEGGGESAAEGAEGAAGGEDTETTP